MKLRILMCVFLVFLSACKETVGVSTEGSSSTWLDSELTAQSTKPSESSISFEKIKLDYSLPKQVADVCAPNPNYDKEEVSCPQVEIFISKISPEWIEKDLNFVITEDNNPKLIKFRRSMNDFALSQLENSDSLGYAWYIEPSFMGIHKNVAQFSVSKELYLGGAHGFNSVDYYLYDLTLGSRIQLGDIYRTDGLGDTSLVQLLSNTYHAFLAKEHGMSPSEIAEHESAYEITVTENVYFGKNGLVFSYYPYELGPYAMGPIELEIDYDQLTEILRPEYLPN